MPRLTFLLGGYHAIAHTVGVDVLAFGCPSTTRNRIQICTSSLSGSICGLDRSRGLPHSGDRLHRQDEVTVACLSTTRVKLNRNGTPLPRQLRPRPSAPLELLTYAPVTR